MILIGELRDAETAQTALQAAESGHLVFSTLHTIDAAETVGRMIEFFPPEKQQQIRSILAGVLRGVISQRLLPRVGGGRVAAVEVMVMNARIADLIREERTEEIADAVAEGSFFDMQTFEQALIDVRPRGHGRARDRIQRGHERARLQRRARPRAQEPDRRHRERTGRRRGCRRGGPGAHPPRHPSRGGVMRRLAAAALLALVLGVGTASADTFAVVPDSAPDNFVVVPDGPVTPLPSAEIPNEPGSILLPPRSVGGPVPALA